MSTVDLTYWWSTSSANTDTGDVFWGWNPPPAVPTPLPTAPLNREQRRAVKFARGSKHRRVLKTLEASVS